VGCFCEIFFLDSQLNSSKQKNLDSNSLVQKFSTNGGQSHLKLQSRIQKNFLFPTLNAHIFESVWSNFMKFLSHNLKQIKYKIIRLGFMKNVILVFLGECNSNGNFEWF